MRQWVPYLWHRLTNEAMGSTPMAQVDQWGNGFHTYGTGWPMKQWVPYLWHRLTNEAMGSIPMALVHNMLAMRHEQVWTIILVFIWVWWLATCIILYFPGDDLPGPCTQYITQLFNQRKPANKEIYCHVTCAIDRDLMKTIIDDIMQIIININLKMAGTPLWTREYEPKFGLLYFTLWNSLFVLCVWNNVRFCKIGQDHAKLMVCSGIIC